REVDHELCPPPRMGGRPVGDHPPGLADLVPVPGQAAQQRHRTGQIGAELGVRTGCAAALGDRCRWGGHGVVSLVEVTGSPAVSQSVIASLMGSPVSVSIQPHWPFTFTSRKTYSPSLPRMRSMAPKFSPSADVKSRQRRATSAGRSTARYATLLSS